MTDPTPAQPRPTADPAVVQVRAWIRRALRLARSQARTTLIYMGVGLAVGWAINVLAMGAAYGGFYTPAGSAVSGVGNQVPGFAFSFLASTLVASVIAYRITVGPEQFSRELRAIPADIRAVLKGNAPGARTQLLLGVGTALLATAILGPSIAFVMSLFAAVAFAPLLRPIVTGLVLFAYGLVSQRLLPARTRPTGQAGLQAASVALVGAGAGFLVGWLLPTSPGPPIATVVLAVLAMGGAIVLSRGPVPAGGAGMVVLAVAGGLVGALTTHVGLALADDGGFSECGNLGLVGWLTNCKGSGGVLLNSLLGGFGSGLGAGLGSGLGRTANDPRRGWQAAFDGGFDGFTDQIQFMGNRDVVNPLNILAALGGAPDEVLLTDDARALRQWTNSGQARSLYEEFAADPLDFANKHGFGEWLADFPNQDHGPITRDDMARYGALYDEYKQARASGDDYNANRLRGMLLATTVWIGGQVVSPETLAEGAAARMGTRTAVGGLERIGVSEVGVLERNAISHIPADIPLTAQQRALLERGLLRLEPIESGGVNQSVRIIFEDGHAAILKPDAGGKNTIYEVSLAGTKSQREVGTYLTDQHLGFNQVPTTAIMDHPELGRSSVQAWSESQAFNKTADAFSTVDQQKAAVLDYITGNHDRHMGNVLQGTDNRLIAIDHGETFPTGERPTILRSDMISAQANTPLDPSVVQAVRSVDPAALRQDLLASGLTPSQVDGAIARLNEVATQGQITGSGLNQQWIVINPGNPAVRLGAPPP